MLARELARRGHQVRWFSSSYDHFDKNFRGKPGTEVNVGETRVHWLDTMAYRSNVSLARLRGNRRMAAHFRRMATSLPKPEVILASFPVPELADAAVDFGKRYGVPCFIDIRDWWPDIFETAMPKVLRPFKRLLLAPLQRVARRTCADATGILGITEPFVEWGLKKGGRQRTALDRAFPFGYTELCPSDEEVAEAERYWRQLGLETGRHQIVVFLGTLSRTLDVPTILTAARGLLTERKDLRFVFAGRGDFQERFEEECRDVPELIFPGWIGQAQIWTLLRMACVALNPMPERPDFLATINNKAVEYLAAGLPVICSPDRGVVHDLVTRHLCGFGYETGNVSRLVEALSKLLDNDALRREAGRNARRLFEERFVAEKVYGAMCQHLEIASQSGVGAKGAMHKEG